MALLRPRPFLTSPPPLPRERERERETPWLGAATAAVTSDPALRQPIRVQLVSEPKISTSAKVKMERSSREPGTSKRASRRDEAARRGGDRGWLAGVGEERRGGSGSCCRCSWSRHRVGRGGAAARRTRLHSRWALHQPSPGTPGPPLCTGGCCSWRRRRRTEPVALGAAAAPGGEGAWRGLGCSFSGVAMGLSAGGLASVLFALCRYAYVYIRLVSVCVYIHIYLIHVLHIYT